MENKLKSELLIIANQLNYSNITWAIGASMMLKLRDFDINVHDIDIMVHQDDFEIACNRLNEVCEEISVAESNLFRTKHFKRFKCDDIEIDIMSGMGIMFKTGFFDYQFNKDDIEKVIQFDSIKLPLCYIEDWYVFYHLMPNRYPTIQKIEIFFNENRFISERFNRILKLDIPYHIQLLLTELIENKNIKF